MEPSLLLSRRDLAGLATFGDYLAAAEQAFQAHARARPAGENGSGLLHCGAQDGEFHIKTGTLRLDRTYVAVKVNGGFPHNRERYGLAAILGTVALLDGNTGQLIALMDSAELTRNRTAAAVALAARYLARPDARVLTLCGCGTQGRAQLEGLSQVLPLAQAFAFDRDPECSRNLAADMTSQLGFPVQAVTELAAAVRQSDVCVTCTPAREPLIPAASVPPGLFLAAVGADSPGKQELDPAVFANATVVVDLLSQCAQVGELHHALAAGVLRRDQVYAELGAIVSGQTPGRRSPEEVTIFDATGTGLQDAAAAVMLYERARERGAGTPFDFFDVGRDLGAHYELNYSIQSGNL
ncbi:MAG: ornithine cyclodeaminase family protein [Terriglobales bacterium]